MCSMWAAGKYRLNTEKENALRSNKKAWTNEAGNKHGTESYTENSENAE